MSEGAQAATDWKHEYRVLVGEMEATERGWRASESLLRRAASQIAIAAMGQNELLDQCLEAVLESLRAELTPDVLEAALDGLSGSLRQLPRSIGASAADAEIALIMRELVSRFSQASVFREASRPLAMTMERALADNDWVELARGLADTVAHVTSAIDTQKAELEAFLEEVTRQLEQFEGWTDWNMQANAARQADSSTLGSSVDREMSGISSAVDAGSDIVELKRKVQGRLAAVAEEFARFRDAEAARNAEAEARALALTLELDNLKQRTHELSQVLERKEDQLLHDVLTGVHSRYAYERRLQEEYQRWQRHGGALAYTIWDVDRFKLVNDRFGHSAGDKLLKLIGQVLTVAKRGEDFVARIGGEEFVLLLPATTAVQAAVLADRIRLLIAATPFHYKGRPEQVTISCGVTEFREGDLPDTVYRRADAALYRAKAAGRNCCEVD